MKMTPPIAVVGMSGVFPKALTPDAFWQNIVDKVDAISDVPPERWIVEADAMYDSRYIPDKAWSKRAGLVTGFEFDPAGLAINPALLEALDPMHRMVLHAGREAFTQCRVSEESKRRTGVVLAAIALPTDSSSRMTREIPGRSFEKKLWGDAILPLGALTLNDCLAARVTAFPGALLAAGLELGGGSFTLDAACSSSIYAVKLACDQLHNRHCDVMLAGGVSRPECLFTQVGFTQLQALSPSGRCAPFDATADGLVVGEGAGILVLKRLDDALRDGDTVHGVIRGIGLSNDIRGNLIAPESEGQLRAMRSAYTAAGWSPFDIDLMECHSAGTPLGDAVELSSMRTLWGESGWKPEQCAIGSVKSMIGHLLTGAGGAGMIKLLLALKNKTLPPSNNFTRAPANSPLLGGPFRVQTEAVEWKRQKTSMSRRCAISAFGFGGINAHLLFEEWEPNPKVSVSVPAAATPSFGSPVAIVGMEAAFGNCVSLHEFQTIVLRGESVIQKRPENRWRGAETVVADCLNGRGNSGGFMNDVSVDIGEFHIPPNELGDILPQQLLMLKVAARAMRDAGFTPRPDDNDDSRLRMGAVMGIAFDMEATNFHLRWNLLNRVRQWKAELDLPLDGEQTAKWLESLRDACGPPLTSPRTVGALGGIVASRIAKEFQLGGPCFGVSCEEASGLKALEIAVSSLQMNETDAYLVGAVDLCGDIRNILAADRMHPWSASDQIRPFDLSADGSLPGEGAAAVVLKRLDQALEDGDRIYAVIKGLGHASGGGIPTRAGEMRQTYRKSLQRAFDDAQTSPSAIDWVETHGSGKVEEDGIESDVLADFFAAGATSGDKPAGDRKPLFIGSLKPTIGHTGAAAGLASLVKTGLCLYQRMVPPLVGFSRPHNAAWEQSAHVHFPSVAMRQAVADNDDDVPRACVAAMTTDGNCSHALLEGYQYSSRNALPAEVETERIFKPEKTENIATSTDGIAGAIGKWVPLDLKTLSVLDYSDVAAPQGQTPFSNHTITILLGGKPPIPPPAPQTAILTDSSDVAPIKNAAFQPQDASSDQNGTLAKNRSVHDSGSDAVIGSGIARVRAKEAFPETAAMVSPDGRAAAEIIASLTKMIGPLTDNLQATSEAHQRFLDFSNDISRGYAQAFAYQTRLYEDLLRSAGDEPSQELMAQFKSVSTEFMPQSSAHMPNERKTISEGTEPRNREVQPAFSREMCLEFATGSVARMLGTEFAVVDTYPVRVRLPDEPLMLVDRILSVEGEKCSMGAGRVVTEHDVRPGVWYLDGGRAPVCISIEAGQADLFLCSYLGIDHVVKGKRAYRLLDAVTTFHRGLPRAGDVIRYEIEIEKFIRQGETYLFFFHFEGYIGKEHLITMKNGCAGFFTAQEVENSGGIILTEADTQPVPGKRIADWRQPVPMRIESFDERAVEALRSGDLAACFGSDFEGITLAESLRLPGGRMHLLDRVRHLDPEGGRYGLGIIRAEADIHSDDWFLTCHFVDDKVMPGTLMYQCCEHTLRIFTMRMGWVTEKAGVCYEPIAGISSDLKCRGPVTPETKQVTYEVEIKEIGYMPEPYILADAHMFSDNHRIVLFKDMTMKMSGISREEIESFWEGRRREMAPADDALCPVQKPLGKVNQPVLAPIFNREQLLAFAIGNPSECFGAHYAAFDHDRFIARLPGPPYLFIDRITSADPQPWVLKPGGWIEAQYDVKPDDWYFRANRQPSMPVSILMEIALQPCGWLAAYMGSALRSENNLKFRNLGGNAHLLREITPDCGTLTMRARLTQASEAGDMIIESFDMQILQGETIVYEGDTTFGFFTEQALAAQVGLRDIEHVYQPAPVELRRNRFAEHPHVLTNEAPLTPDAPHADDAPPMALPAKAIRMIDAIDIYIPDGGSNQLGYIRGIKTVDPAEWFFKAHFYQDPVCPGSLGVESFVQLLKFAARERWPHLRQTHRFELLPQVMHHWTYRGQILSGNQTIEVEAEVKKIRQETFPMIEADGYLKVDGLYIYKMEGFGLRLVPVSDP